MTLFLMGLLIGFALGCVFYAKVLDKPEIVNKINKQKARTGGFFRNIFNSKEKSC